MKIYLLQKKKKIKWGRCTSTNLSIWAALKTTSNSVLSSSAAFFAISAASIRRDSSRRNWPAMECVNISPQEITDVIHLRQNSPEKDAQKNPKQTNPNAKLINQATNQCLRFNVWLFADLFCISISLNYSNVEKLQ